jgi:hypothetical protein
MFRHVQLSIQVKPEQKIVAHPVLQELTLLTRTRVEVFYKEFQTASVNDPSMAKL